MENISVIPDISKISLLMGYEIVTIYINIGSFPKVLWEVMCLIKKYSSYIKEMYSMNSDLESNFIRIIFYSEIDKNIFREIDEIPGINRIVINSPVKLNIICNKCEIKICPHKISSELSKLIFYKNISIHNLKNFIMSRMELPYKHYNIENLTGIDHPQTKVI